VYLKSAIAWSVMSVMTGAMSCVQWRASNRQVRQPVSRPSVARIELKQLQQHADSRDCMHGKGRNVRLLRYSMLQYVAVLWRTGTAHAEWFRPARNVWF